MDYRSTKQEQQLKIILSAFILIPLLTISGCASPPQSDPSKVDVECAQQCSSHLASCSSGFKLFPVVAQGQCNDTYDVCIKGCPTRTVAEDVEEDIASNVTERLNKLESLLNSGVISKAEYDKKRQEILDSL